MFKIKNRDFGLTSKIRLFFHVMLSNSCLTDKPKMLNSLHFSYWHGKNVFKIFTYAEVTYILAGKATIPGLTAEN